MWLPTLNIGLGLWLGEYQGCQRPWLRWYDAKGNLIPTPVERERMAKKLAQQEKDRERLAQELAQQKKDRERLAQELAQQEKDRERLAQELAQQQVQQLLERLREAGIDPES